MKFMDLMQQIFTGNNIAILGAALATICPGFGSANSVKPWFSRLFPLPRAFMV